ncbi:MAG: peptidylprolyl isomerase [Granulosicoccus sp.]
MKFKTFSILLTMSIAPLSSALATDVVLDDIVAIVNDGVVLSSDVRNETAFIKKQAGSNRQSLPDDAELRDSVLELLVDQEIRRQHARKLGVAVDASSVNRAIERIARSNNMDAIQFRQTLRKEGFNYDHFRRNIEQELLLQRLIQRDVESSIRVSEQEIDDFVDNLKNDSEEQQRYRLQHILIALPSSAPAADVESAKKRAAAVRKRLLVGEDFAAVATATSDGARALQGGDLGWRTLQEFPAFLVNAVRQLEVDAISEPIRSPNGLHIVKLNDKQSGDQSQQTETLARHIFIAGNDDGIRQRLADIKSRVVAGASFEQLAIDLSEDPNSAPNGGELPWFSADQMPAEMEKMADSLKPDTLSEPFRTQFGWHLIEVLDRRTNAIDDDALRKRADVALRQRKIEQQTERWIRQLRDESFIEHRG